MIEIAASESDWLVRFFGAENRLAWADVASETAPLNWLAQVLPWIRSLQKTPPQFPLVLPVFDESGPRRWYGVADDAETTAQMAQELQGFVGPSYTEFDGRLQELSPSDPLEAALRERFGPWAVRFDATSSDDRKEIERQLLLYQAILARRPPTPARGRRPFGRVRADFDRALLAGRANAARDFLTELLDSGRVTAEQQKCLEIRLLSGLGRYEELARNQPLITSIMDLALPPQTLVDVVEALYKTYIVPVESTADLNQVRDIFSRRIGRCYGPLFRERKGLRHPEVLLSFMLYESSLEQPNLARCELLMQAFPGEGQEKGFAQQIIDGIRRSAPMRVGDRFAEVRQAIADEDYAAAADTCFDALPEPWAYSALLRSAVELDSAELAQRVVSVVHVADATIHARLTKKDHDRLDALRLLAQAGHGEKHHVGWIEWAQAAIANPSEFQASRALSATTATWNVEDYVHEPLKCRTLAHLIANASGAAESVFREAFPDLVQFFVDGANKPVRTFIPIYLTLIKIIAWGGVASVDELKLSLSITEALLTTGPEQNSYTECLDDLQEILIANRAPTNLDWSLDLAELLILFPTQAPEVRLRLFMAVVTTVSGFGHRLTAAQRTVLARLARDYECPALIETLPAPDGDDEATYGKFSGLIGIYTLARASGLRAKEALKELLPTARVELNDDTVATDRLKNLAEKADLFVFAWKKSSHQAYYCIKDARGRDDVILPAGGGTASLIRSVLDVVNA